MIKKRDVIEGAAENAAHVCYRTEELFNSHIIIGAVAVIIIIAGFIVFDITNILILLLGTALVIYLYFRYRVMPALKAIDRKQLLSHAVILIVDHSTTADDLAAFFEKNCEGFNEMESSELKKVIMAYAKQEVEQAILKEWRGNFAVWQEKYPQALEFLGIRNQNA